METSSTSTKLKNEKPKSLKKKTIFNFFSKIDKGTAIAKMKSEIIKSSEESKTRKFSEKMGSNNNDQDLVYDSLAASTPFYEDLSEISIIIWFNACNCKALIKSFLSLNSEILSLAKSRQLLIFA